MTKVGQIGYQPGTIDDESKRPGIMQRFDTAYDIQAEGGVPLYSANQIEDWAISLGLMAIVLLIILAVSKEREKKYLLIIPVAISCVAVFLLIDHWDRRGTAATVASGTMHGVEGCVSDFKTNAGEPNSNIKALPDEQWKIRNEYFSYKVGSYAPGYHLRESQGGVVHAGQYLRVTYLISPIMRRKEIMKIEVRQAGCR